jgi:hypothetical protein
MLQGDWVAGVFRVLGCQVYSQVGGGVVQCWATHHVSAACGDSDHGLLSGPRAGSCGADRPDDDDDDRQGKMDPLENTKSRNT